MGRRSWIDGDVPSDTPQCTKVWPGHGMQRVRGATEHFLRIFPGDDWLAIAVKLEVPALQVTPLRLVRRQLVARQDAPQRPYGFGAFSLAVSISYVTNCVIFTVYFLHLDIFQSLKAHSYLSLPTFSGFTFRLNFLIQKFA